MSLSVFLKALRDAPAELDKVVEWARARSEAIKLDEDLTPEGRQKALAAMQVEAERRAAEIFSEARDARDATERYGHKALKVNLPTAEAMLSEQQETRAWQRAQRLLEAGTSAREVIDAAGEAGDTATLRALRAELPAWLESRAVASSRRAKGSIAGNESARQAALQRSEELVVAIDRAELPHLPNRQREAVEAKYEAAALDKALNARRLMVSDAASGRVNPVRRLEAAYATADAERALLGPTGNGDVDA